MPEIPQTDQERADTAYDADLAARAINLLGTREAVDEVLDYAATLPPREKADYQARLKRVDQVEDAVRELSGRMSERGLPPAKPFASLQEFTQARYASERDGNLQRDYARRLANTPQSAIDAWSAL